MQFCGTPATRPTSTRSSPDANRASRPFARPAGLSGYPSREESPHDLIENSHASTVLSYADGLASARDLGTNDQRHIVAVVGDGAMTGGMAYEALNNMGHHQRGVIVVLNDNGRSYAPTISNLSANSQGYDVQANHPSIPDRVTGRLSHALTDIRQNPVYVRRQRRLEEFLQGLPLVGNQAGSAMEAFKAGVREFLQPPSFFEALGARYIGPFDGHDVEQMEHAFHNAIELSTEGPIVVHVLTQKGRGYSPAEDDDEKNLHDAPVFDPLVGPPKAVSTGYTQAFAESIIKEAENDSRLVAITAAMPGPTGLLPFEARFPDRFFDVGIAEQHAVTSAAGMAMGGLRPVVAIYSTFLNRAWDQVVYDVAMHRLPVIFCLDRAGVTGPDGASHHGVYDMALLSKVPGMRVLVPSSAQELAQMLHDATSLADDGPVVIRYPRGAARQVSEHEVGVGLNGRKVRAAADAASSVCVIAIGKMLETAEKAAAALADDGVDVTVWDAAFVCAARPADDRRRHSAPARGHDRGRDPRRRHRDGDRHRGRSPRRVDPGDTTGPADEVPPARSEVEQHPCPLRARRRRPGEHHPQRLTRRRLHRPLRVRHPAQHRRDVCDMARN